MAATPLKLAEGTRVAVIGGGPAGSFFAYLLLRETARLGLHVNLTVFDMKDFQVAGRRGCNMCAGTLSGQLIRQLEAEGYQFPPQVVQRHISGYVIHSRRQQAQLTGRPDEPIYTVFRGIPFPEMAYERGSFDQFLLDQAEAHGARCVHTLVRRVVMPSSPGEVERQQACRTPEPIRLELASGVFEADLVVGAFGVNSGLAQKFVPDYVAPKVWRACQGEVALPGEFITERYGDQVHIFLGDGREIKFLALTPKRNHVTVTAIGPDVKKPGVIERMKESDIAGFVPENWEFRCHCHPAFPVSAARRPYADRVVVVGDACVSRYLKNGIESAYFTARFAVETILRHGYSAEAFRRHYVPACWRKYKWDNLFGKIVFRLNDLFCRLPTLANAHVRAVRSEQNRLAPEKRLHSRILWDMFTGDCPYSRIFLRSLDPRVQARTAWETAKEIVARLRARQ